MIFVCFTYEIDKVVTIYGKFRFDYHKGKQPGMVYVPILKPIMVFSKRLDMWSVRVILLQYQRQVLSENFRYL